MLPGRAAQHLLGLFADGFDFTGVLVDGDDGGLVDHDALAAGIDERVGGSEIDGEIAGEHAEQRTHVARRATFYEIRWMTLRLLLSMKTYE